MESGSGMAGPRDAAQIARHVDMALGRVPADVVIRGTRFLDPAGSGFLRGDVAIGGEWIVSTGERCEGREEIDGRDLFVVPGFIDAHVHLESSLVTPREFERLVLPRGTTAAVADPHEIANVLGVAGIEWVLAEAEGLALDLFVMLPSCVPATDLETAGARLTAADLAPLRGRPGVLGLAEVMNFPGVLGGDPEVLAKLAAFAGGPVDGHAPLVAGRDLSALRAAGIGTCHESTSLAEGRAKLSKGFRVFLREGSVAKDVAALAGLLDGRSAPLLAFCTDDRNPLDILGEGHVDHAIRAAIAAGADPRDAYRAASRSAAEAFGLADRGLVAPGFRADLVLLGDPERVEVRGVVKDGRPVGPGGVGREGVPAPGRHSVRLDPVSGEDCRLPVETGPVPVIGIVPGSLVTDHLRLDPRATDVLPLLVFARHGSNRNVGRGRVRGLGLSRGALASTVGHDSHNLIVAGADPADMAAAVNRLIAIEGGFVAVAGGRVLAELPLPVAGLLSLLPFEEVGERLRALRRAAAELGCPLDEPFLQLAFLSLPVIPHLKLTDRGLVDVDRFSLL